MSREKQIEEIANILWHIPGSCFLNSYDDCTRIAECIYDDGGYRKQSEPISCSHEKDGEWISVDERLPEQCVPVLVYKNSNSEVYGNMETAYFGKGVGEVVAESLSPIGCHSQKLRTGMNLSAKCNCCVCEPVCRYKEVYQNGIEAILNTMIAADEVSFWKMRECPHIEVIIKCPHMVTKSGTIQYGGGE